MTGGLSSEERISSLPCWRGRLTMEPLKGGISNESWKVRDATGAWVVRFGGDNPHHGILRWHEKAASRAAAELGISPAIRFEGDGVLVLAFIEGHAFTEADVRTPANIPRVGEVIARVHREMLAALRGPVLAFHPFQINADYMARLRRDGSPHGKAIEKLEAANVRLERASRPAPLAFGHNDLLPANFIDDGKRLWLIDWEYSGVNTVFFDLGGVASNASMDEDETRALLEHAHGRAPIADDLRAMAISQAQSLLRETVWSMTSELHSDIDFDFAGYTLKNMERFEAALAALDGV
jgi:thiamine kinase-like enzyme